MHSAQGWHLSRLALGHCQGPTTGTSSIGPGQPSTSSSRSAPSLSLPPSLFLLIAPSFLALVFPSRSLLHWWRFLILMVFGAQNVDGTLLRQDVNGRAPLGTDSPPLRSSPLPCASPRAHALQPRSPACQPCPHVSPSLECSSQSERGQAQQAEGFAQMTCQLASCNTLSHDTAV